MNMFLQRGVCYSPPFPRKEAVCASVDVHSFYDELHTFEYTVKLSSHSKEALDAEDRKRHHRIRNCTHDWDTGELDRIMKPMSEMKNGGW
jgi:uncharacterized protein